jgi:hypothetical protein
MSRSSTQEVVDGMALLVSGKFPGSVSELMQRALNVRKAGAGRGAICRSWQGGTCALHQEEEGRRVHRTSSVKPVGTCYRIAEVPGLSRMLSWLEGNMWNKGLAKCTLPFGFAVGPSTTSGGLKSKVMQWLYTGKVRPVLVFRPSLWWPRGWSGNIQAWTWSPDLESGPFLQMNHDEMIPVIAYEAQSEDHFTQHRIWLGLLHQSWWL